MNLDPVLVHRIFGIIVGVFALIMLLREIDVLGGRWTDYLDHAHAPLRRCARAAACERRSGRDSSDPPPTIDCAPMNKQTETKWRQEPSNAGRLSSIERPATFLL